MMWGAVEARIGQPQLGSQLYGAVRVQARATARAKAMAKGATIVEA